MCPCPRCLGFVSSHLRVCVRVSRLPGLCLSGCSLDTWAWVGERASERHGGLVRAHPKHLDPVWGVGARAQECACVSTHGFPVCVTQTPGSRVCASMCVSHLASPRVRVRETRAVCVRAHSCPPRGAQVRGAGRGGAGSGAGGGAGQVWPGARGGRGSVRAERAAPWVRSRCCCWA